MVTRDTARANDGADTLIAATILLMSAHARDGGGARLADAVLRLVVG